MRILQISVFYRNNVPSGFGYSFDYQPPTLNHIWETITTQGDAMWADEPGDKTALVELLTQQLEAIAAKPERSRSFADVLLALMNVYVLEKAGVLHSDEYNGIVVARELKRPQG